MEYTIRVTMADPAGNRTALVEGEIPRQDYGPVAAQLLGASDLAAEQVGFVCPALGDTAVGRLEMMGGEFCGNASRSFGLFMAQRRGLGETEIPIEISGAKESLLVKLQEGEAWVQMPLPKEITTLALPQLQGEVPLVDLGGIVQVLLPGIPPQEALGRESIHRVYDLTGSPAVGVLFWSGDTMTPLVWVKETDSFVWESSCGSGTLAVAAYRSQQTREGITALTLRQPGGVLRAQVRREEGVLVSASLGGPVTLEETVVRTIQLPDPSLEDPR